MTAARASPQRDRERGSLAHAYGVRYQKECPAGGINEEDVMAWTTPTLVEICIGLEINGYLPAEF